MSEMGGGWNRVTAEIQTFNQGTNKNKLTNSLLERNFRVERKGVSLFAGILQST